MSRLYLERQGDGPPVVFLHAGVVDSRIWQPQWDVYDGFTLVRCDLPGFGRTPLEPGKLTAGRELATLLDELGIASAALVGNSFGAQLALELAVARPELVRALVLVGASRPGMEWSAAVQAYGDAEAAALARGDLDGATELSMRMWFDGPRRERGDVDQTKRAGVAAMCRRAYELQQPLGDSVEYVPFVPDLAERVGGVRAPALVVYGAEDVHDIVDAAPRLAAALPDATVVAIPAAAHFPSFERPDEFDALVLPFLRGA